MTPILYNKNRTARIGAQTPYAGLTNNEREVFAMARKSLHELLGGRSKFGMLTVKHEVVGSYVPSNGTYRRNVVCLCDCGEIAEVEVQRLKRGITKSCGCYGRAVVAERSRKHGHSAGGKRTPEYAAWKDAKARCYIKSVNNYDNYGGRGIRMCQRWLDSFDNFLEDMGQRPSISHSLDRIDVDGNYEPGNCRWADLRTQSNNKRNNLVFTYKGKKYTCAEAAAEFGFKPHTLAKRINSGWPINVAIETPLRAGYRPKW